MDSMIFPFSKHIKFIVCGIVFLGIHAASPVHAANRDLDKAVKTMAKKLCKGMRSSATVVIPSFLTVDKKNTQLGFLIAEGLLDRFANTTPWVPVERDFMYEVSQEIRLEMTGAVDPETVKQIGKFSGAKYIVVGLFHEIGDEIQINARLVNIETSRIEKAAHVSLKATPEIQALLCREIKMEAKQVQEPSPAVRLNGENVRKPQPPAAQSSKPFLAPNPTLVLNQEYYEMHYRPSMPDPQKEEKAKRAEEDWYRKREAELDSVSQKQEALNKQVADQAKERAREMDLAADRLWQKHQDDYKDMLDRVNRPGVIIYSLQREHAQRNRPRYHW